MDRWGRLDRVFVDLADGTLSAHAPGVDAASSIPPDPVDAALQSLVSFWVGEFTEASACGRAAIRSARAGDEGDAVQALCHAVAALAAAGDLHADPESDWAVGVDLLRSAGDPASAWWVAVRYLLAEAALVTARLDDAAAVLATGPLACDAWDGHRFSPILAACEVRILLFSGRVEDARALLEPMRAMVADGSRVAPVVDALAATVLGNADDVGDLARCVELVSATDAAPRDFVDRGLLLLLAFSAIALGQVATAARMVFAAGRDGDLSSCTIIDRALGLEMLLVAALDEEDLPAAGVWLEALELLGAHSVARPTVQRARGRHLLASGRFEEAIAEVAASVEACRASGRAIEAAEGEIVLARARIATEDVSGAMKSLRALVSTSDTKGHHAVRRSATHALQPARRRLPPVAGAGWEALSAREQQVARAILAGSGVEQIAAELFLSPATVRTHVSRVLCAFGVPSRIGLLAAVGMDGVEGPSAPPAALSPRQAQVAGLVAAGAPNQAIAEQMGISVKGVEKHVRDILARWEVPSRFELARTWRLAQSGATVEPATS